MAEQTTVSTVADQIPVATVRRALRMLLDEVMEQVNGFVLDRGTSMFETLATITAEEASRPVSTQSASLAAQVNHTGFPATRLVRTRIA